MICAAVCLQAQPRMKFEQTELSLGEILWKKPETVCFVVMNEGNAPLVISRVEVSCDCLVSEWTKKPIPPKGKGEVIVTYNASMLGHFWKSVEVYSNAADEPVYLDLKGVVRSQITDFSKEFPIEMGSLYLDKGSIEFPDVNRGEKPVVEIGIANASDSLYAPVLMHLPSYLEAVAVPDTLKPKQYGTIRVTLHSEKLTGLGLTNTSVYLSRRYADKVGEENEIPVMAVLLPDFSKLTAAERMMAPDAQLSTSNLILTLNGKKKVSGVVTLANKGRSVLELRELQISDPGINVSMKKRKLKPGETMKMKITAVASYLKNRKYAPRVLMITNDPAHPKVEIRVEIRK